MVTATRKRQKQAKGNAAGRALVDTLERLADALEKGDRSTLTVRTIEVPDPSEYSGRAVKVLREKLGVSQQIFAAMVGVSPELVRHWEYGIRKPSPMARRLLDIINSDIPLYMANHMKTKTEQPAGRKSA